MTPLMCLAAAVFFEARDQPLEGQRAVAEVVLNRVASPRWPDEVCEVVFERKQFSFTPDGKHDRYWEHMDNVFDRQAARIAEAVAISALDGDTIGLTSTHYHATYVTPSWSTHYKRDGQIGSHIFYTAPEGK
jgi:spore germination cell wall hydrolase CwlJ-like protein